MYLLYLTLLYTILYKGSSGCVVKNKERRKTKKAKQSIAELLTLCKVLT